MMSNPTIALKKEEQSPELSAMALKLCSQQMEPVRPWLTWPDGSRSELPEPLLQILLLTAQALNRKQGVTVVVRSEWLTTSEAADMMGCSRPHVVELIKSKQLKSTKIGTHHRIRLHDLLDFINARDEKRDQAMADLVDLTEEIGGYDTANKAETGKP
jgi:excisionase family DNA binding protein